LLRQKGRTQVRKWAEVRRRGTEKVDADVRSLESVLVW